MSSRARTAVRIWRARAPRTVADHGYLAYMVLMVALVTVAPLARAVWMSATSTDGVDLLRSPGASTVTALIAVGLWAAGLLMGRDRGPALHPPFLTLALVTSDIPRVAAFRGPLARAGSLVIGVTTSTAALIASSLAAEGMVAPLDAVVFAAVGTMVGVITTVAWLAGQAFPRTAIPVAFVLVVLGVVTALVPVVQPFVPWGWVGLSYPGSGSAIGLAPLCALTAALIAAVPALMSRLAADTLTTQASRWESAVTHAAGSMDFNSAAAVYQRRPRIGRRARAVRPMRRLWVTFLLRDAIGAARTPGRLAVGTLAVAGAGVLIASAFAPGAPQILLGVGSGVLLFAGLGPLTDGIRHAAHVAGDLPLYGLSDRQLLVNHSLFPLAVMLIVLATAVLVSATVIGLAPALPVMSAVIVGVLTVSARVSNALKGPLPPSLLAPIPTPMGDLGAAVRLIWALDGVLLAGFAGASAVLLLQAPVLLIGVALATIGIGFARWHR